MLVSSTSTAKAPASQADANGILGAGWGPTVQEMPGNIVGNRPAKKSTSVTGENDKSKK